MAGTGFIQRLRTLDFSEPRSKIRINLSGSHSNKRSTVLSASERIKKLSSPKETGYLWLLLFGSKPITMGVLTIKLKSISNLIDEDGLGKSDPYVVFELEKDKWLFDKSMGKNKSSKKKNQTSPVYNETFSIPNVPTTNNMKLHIYGKYSNGWVGTTRLPSL